MPTAQREDVTLYYEAHGAAGDPLLCIMGLGGDLAFWERQIPAFAARHRTLVFDNRGVGKSSKPPGPYSVQLMADDAVAVLDAAGVARAHVLGLSMGGMIAQSLALRHPGRVGALVLAATFSRPDQGVREVTAQGAARLGAPSQLSRLAETGGLVDLSGLDVKSLFKFMMSLVLSPEFIAREKEWLRSIMQRMLDGQGSVGSFMAQVGAVLKHDVTAELALLRAPTLVLTGTADQLVPPHHSELLASQIPGARLVAVDGGTHGFNVEMPERFNREVLDFLAAHPL
jgi:pimeloyl-ACP methyl ester carboxylesterase